MNIHQFLCKLGFHWWKSGPFYRRDNDEVPYIDYCRCCGKVLTKV